MNTNDWIVTWWLSLGGTVALLDTTKWGLLRTELNSEFKDPLVKIMAGVVFFLANVFLMWPDTLHRMLKKANTNGRK